MGQSQELDVPIGAPGIVAIEGVDGFEDLPTLVEDVFGMNINLTLPKKEGRPVVPKRGEILSVTINGPGSEKKFVDGEVINHRLEPTATMRLRVVAMSGHETRRQHYRLTLILPPIACYAWGQDTEDGPAYWRPLAATIQNVSAGGARLVSEDTLEKGTRLRLRFPLPASVEQFVADAQVVASLPSSRGNAAGLQFRDISPDQGERIAKHIHMFQLESRRVGLASRL